MVKESAHKDSRYAQSVVLCDKKGAGVRHNVRGGVGMVAHGLENRSVTLLRSDNTPHVNTCWQELHEATLDAQVLHAKQIARRRKLKYIQM